MDNNNKKLHKSLNIWDVLVVAFGAMIGWGWVVSSGEWIQSGGVIGTIIGFIIGGLMIFCVGLTYAELTPAMPVTGGELTFSYKAFGATGSYICTWSLILSYIGVVCFEACSLPTILQYIFPHILQGKMYTVAGYDVYASWVAIGVGFSLLITIINLFGIKKAAILQKILTCIIAGVGILLFVASMFTGDSSNISTQVFVGDNGGDIVLNILKVAMITPFFFFGFDVIPQTAGEISIPLKKIGRIMLLSIILAVSFYSMVVLGIGFVFNNAEITESINTTGLVTADAMAKAFNSQAMATVMIFGGLCGIITTWNSFVIGGSRAIYSMSRARMLPSMFSKIGQKHKTPFMSVVLVGVASIVAPFFGRTMLVWIVDAANFACCLAYCMVAISFLVLRKKMPEMDRPYKIKNYKLIGGLAVIMSAFFIAMYIIPGTGCSLVWQEWIIVGLWAIAGIVFYIRSRVLYKDRFACGVDSI